MKLAFREKLAFGAGDTASNLVFMTMLNFLPYFYTDIFGISAAAVGTLLLFVRVGDAFIDVSVGVIADRTHTRWGKFRPWLLWFAVPFGVAAVLTFTTPDWTENSKIVYAWVTYSILMVAYSAINVPYGALSAVMTTDLHERTSLSGVRMVFAQIGGLIVAGGTLPLIAYFSGDSGDRAHGYQMTMILFGSIATALFLITFFGTRERIEVPADQENNLKADLLMLIKNRPWVVISVSGAILFIFFSVRMAVVMYYFNYYVGDESQATLFFTLASIAAIPGALLSAPISKRIGKKRTFQLGAAFGVLSLAAFYFVPADSFWLLHGLNAFASVSIYIMAPLIFSMLGDSADYADWKFKRRSTGIIFSASALVGKVGMGLGGALTGLLLTYFGYVAGSDQSEETVRGIVIMASIVPAVGYLIILGFMELYNLDEEMAEQMRMELERRREKATS
ncbi:MFS transporter [Pelagicoccus albus]|uniref:MFS transporter n=1 Tax=Pelagicoccus albus TaxID=415222 RepID=A0A7X1B3Q5_9BACT|nr:MFS transporter [Pelagicoccus albus]MBC2605037.1 MFS transporter [Pelagicoccus albus]